MIVYLDSSVVLRRFLMQANPLENWSAWQRAYTSELTMVEAFRAIDRERLSKRLDDNQVADLMQFVFSLRHSADLVEITPAILKKASEPFPVLIDTLDAIHLGTARFLRDSLGSEIHFLTHDQRQGIAARAVGFDVIGVAS